MSKIAGNMSQTFVKINDDGKKVFIKQKDANQFDIRSLTFQSQLQGIIRGKFNINKFKDLQIKNSESKMDYIIEFDYVEHQDWVPDEENMKIIGTAMAHLHNFAYHNRNFIKLNIKDEKYDKMDKWYIPVPAKYKDIRDEFREKREAVFANLQPISDSQPKIALHRDFKPHNILFDGTNYHLIDFDFAAIDYVSLEIMAFVVDILETGFKNVETFLKAYLDMIDFSIDRKSIVSDYLNYLCTNTFPFYMASSLDEVSFMNLVNHRDRAFDLLIEHKEDIENILTTY